VPIDKKLISERLNEQEETMANHFSEEYIRREIANVNHPAINCSLIELGIIKNIEVKPEKVIITMAFPFPNIPIEDYLKDLVREAIEEVDAEVEIETVVMTKEALQKFLALEKEHWRNGA
jgi:metal-sulfur cluster biosynthetic enzyme